MNYLEASAVKIKGQLHEDLRKYDEIFYLNMAALCRIKGADTTASDVHDAWNATRAAARPGHYLLPFEALGEVLADKYLPFVEAIHTVATAMATKQAEFEAILSRVDKLWHADIDQPLPLDEVLQEMDQIYLLIDNLAPKLYQNWIEVGESVKGQEFIDQVIKPYRNLVKAQTPKKRGQLLIHFANAVAMLNWCLEYDGSNPDCPLWLSETKGL